jgi:hypothetical protein
MVVRWWLLERTEECAMTTWRSNQRLRCAATVLLVLSVVSSVAYGQSKPNLSGRWQSTKQKPQITVQQDDRLFVVSTSSEDGRLQDLRYKLDGSESSNTVSTATGRTWTYASRASWVNSAVVITTTTTTDTGAKWDWLQVYLLDPDGHLSITTVDGVITNAQAMFASTILYDKVREAR